MEKLNSNNIKDVKKGLKSYLAGKKLFDSDKKKSYKYFQQSLKYLTKCKEDKNVQNKYKKILEETETECYKYLNSTIDTIDYTPSSATEVEPDIFNLIQEGDINKIFCLKDNDVDFNVFNSEGLSPLHMCIKNGDLRLLKYFLKLNGRIDQVNNSGHTLLEYACLQQDPSVIAFLLSHGANMKKHLYFREGTKKYFLKKSDIDLAIIMKIVLINNNNNSINDKLNFVSNYIDLEEKVGLDDFSIKDLVVSIGNMFENKDSFDEYIDIIKEELSYPLKKKFSCPVNKIDILLLNLVPFINYPFNISIHYIVSLEMKYIITKMLN